MVVETPTAAVSSRRMGVGLWTRRTQVIVAVVAGLLSGTGVAGERRLTVDDLLSLSEVGRAAVQPGTDNFVWEQSPPYDTLQDFGAGAAGTWQESDFEIMSLKSGTLAPEHLFVPQPRTTYRLGSFTADGRFLTLLAMRDGRAIVAIYDCRRRRLSEFSLSPRFHPVQTDPDWAWVDNRRLAVAAYSTGDGPYQLTFRRSIANHLNESWQKSWRGKEPSVDRYDSVDVDERRPLPGRLVLIDAISHDIRDIASGQFSGLRPSPDGHWLAAVRQSMLNQTTVEHPHVDWTFARSSLSMFALHGVSREREVSPTLDVLPDSMVWNPSSSRLAFFAAQDEIGLRDGRFAIVDPVTCAVTLGLHDGLGLASQRSRGGPQWPEPPVWVGNSLAVFARATPGQRGTLTFEDASSRKAIEAGGAATPISPHWYLLRANAAPVDLTPGMRTVSPIPILADDTHFVVLGDAKAWRLNAAAPPTLVVDDASLRLDDFALQDVSHASSTADRSVFSTQGSHGSLAQITLVGDEATWRVWAAQPEASVLAVASAGTALAQIGFGKRAALSVMRSGSAPRMLGEINPHLDGIAETRWIDFPYAGIEDTSRPRLSGCLLLPPGYHADLKYPLVVEVYPNRAGGCGAPRTRRYLAMGVRPTSYSEHLLAARDFIVFRPDTGGDISRTAAGPQANLSAVVDRGIDAVLEAGYGDSTRIGLLGFSQGGFASLWLATQSSRYKAVVSLNGWSDLVNDFFDMHWAEELAPTDMPSQGDSEKYLVTAGTSFTMGGTPWQIPERYVGNSPLWNSNRVTAPVLLIHSDMDGFDDANYRLFFTSLYIQKKIAKLLIYRGEGHSPSSPANIRDMWSNITQWFDQYLGVTRDVDGKMRLDAMQLYPSTVARPLSGPRFGGDT